MKSPDKEPEYEDLTPSWEVTARMLLLIIKEGTDLENKQWAESEVIRMGRIIDGLKQKLEAQQAIAESVRCYECGAPGQRVTASGAPVVGDPAEP
tara:strand:+ start:266 stop:550 length:285 start_codon:yes stop_codon:yes gene_type:complete